LLKAHYGEVPLFRSLFLLQVLETLPDLYFFTYFSYNTDITNSFLQTMQIVSMNVNGIRAADKKGAVQKLFDTQADIIALQETKATADQLGEHLVRPEGYHAYYESSRVRKGYSGVAVYSRVEPLLVEYGFGEEKWDDEGRLLVLHFPRFVFMNCYFPNGGKSEEHFEFKLAYYDKFLAKALGYVKEGKSVVFGGDLNVAHHPIDLARPKENEKSIGFLPVERAWLDRVEAAGFIDTYRSLYPDTVKYSWWDMKTRSRERNVGWRIDYLFVSKDLQKHIAKAEIWNEFEGSDHCPVVLDLTKI